MRVIDLGVTDFSEIYQLQREFVERVALGICEDTLLVTEHNPVITIGRTGSEQNVFRREIHVVQTDRGGDVTYHGPGQLIAYPIFKLENESRDIHRFLEFLEEIGSAFLAQYGIFTEKRPGLRGVWTDNKKIGSIGIGVKKWVTYHGLAMNINTDLMPFSFIRPCGIEGVEITSLKSLLKREIDMDDAKNRLISTFKEIPLLAETVSKN
ncbi:MAG: lipoyl(octanoyl) transferase LipB [Candidatus Gorgyraea atricola]|nr:lipoyl(octanoyl) transferase LipB [Candidatus Gorgyraea atricola]